MLPLIDEFVFRSNQPDPSSGAQSSLPGMKVDHY